MMPIKELLWALGLTWGVFALVGCGQVPHRAVAQQTAYGSSTGTRYLIEGNRVINTRTGQRDRTVGNFVLDTRTGVMSQRIGSMVVEPTPYLK